MHPADIKAELAKRGKSLSAFDRDNRFTEGATSHALRFGSPKVERALARFLNLPLKTLFPKRYTSEGQRLLPRERVANTYRIAGDKSTSLSAHDQQIAS